MTQQERLVIAILYRTEKSALAMIEKEFAGQVLEPAVATVVEKKRGTVAELERRIGKGKWRKTDK